MRVAVAILILVTTACGPSSAPSVTATPPPPTGERKLEWILQLEDQRVVRGEQPGEDLLLMLQDGQAHIRRRAALATGRVRSLDAVTPLTAMLAGEQDPEVRQMAAFALGLIGSPAAAEPLTEALASTDPLLQGRAAEALGLLGTREAAPAIAAMMTSHLSAGTLDGLASDDVGYPKAAGVEAVRLGLYALVRLGAYDALASAMLDGGGQPRSTWWPVAYAFQRVGDARAAAPLLTLLKADGQLTRAFAARGLGELKHEAAAPALTALALDGAQPPAVRIQAVRALGALGHAEAGKTLAEVITAPRVDAALQLEAVTALGRLRAPLAIDALLDLATAPWPSLRAAALVALARIDPDLFLGAISGIGDDPHWSVRAAMAQALGEVGAERATARLTGMLEDEDQRVIPSVLTALAAVRAQGADTILAARLTADDVAVRLAAANGLAQLEATGQTAAISAALDHSARDSSYVARAALLQVLTRLDPQGARPALERALEDKDWAVRVRAAMLLRELDPEHLAVPVTPAPSSPLPEMNDVAKLLSPAFTPTAYIDTDKGVIQVELAVVDAPRTVANFTALVQRGYFNNLSWHRVVADFVAQGGDPRGDGEGGPGHTIRDELNQRPYLRGTVGMALDWADTGGSQFFITHSPQPHLDTRYTVFGQVVAGMDVVDNLRQWDTIRGVRIWDGVAWIGSGGGN